MIFVYVTEDHQLRLHSIDQFISEELAADITPIEDSIMDLVRRPMAHNDISVSRYLLEQLLSFLVVSVECPVAESGLVRSSVYFEPFYFD